MPANKDNSGRPIPRRQRSRMLRYRIHLGFFPKSKILEETHLTTNKNSPSEALEKNSKTYIFKETNGFSNSTCEDFRAEEDNINNCKVNGYENTYNAELCDIDSSFICSSQKSKTYYSRENFEDKELNYIYYGENNRKQVENNGNCVSNPANKDSLVNSPESQQKSNITEEFDLNLVKDQHLNHSINIKEDWGKVPNNDKGNSVVSKNDSYFSSTKNKKNCYSLEGPITLEGKEEVNCVSKPANKDCVVNSPESQQKSNIIEEFDMNLVKDQHLNHSNNIKEDWGKFPNKNKANSVVLKNDTYFCSTKNKKNYYSLEGPIILEGKEAVSCAGKPANKNSLVNSPESQQKSNIIGELDLNLVKDQNLNHSNNIKKYWGKVPNNDKGNSIVPKNDSYFCSTKK